MSRWKYYDPNHKKRHAIDCAVRAVSAALGIDWDWAFCLIVSTGFSEGDMGVAKVTWGTVLRRHGFKRAIIPNTCPECYTVENFCIDHPTGIYVIATEDHAVCVIDGYAYDSWDSTGLIPQYYWYKEG